MRSNPFWWLHSRLGGGSRTCWLLALGYVAIVLVFTTITYRFVSAPPGKVPDYGPFYTVWLGVVSGAQAVLVLILLPSAIKRAVQRDYQTGMADSHRISPMSNWTIVLGFLGGPALQPLVIFVPGLVMGTIFAARCAATMGVGLKVGAQVFVGGWLVLQGLLLVVALLLSSLSLLSAVTVREGKFNILGLLIAASFLGGWVAILFVPGLALLSGAASASLLWSLLGKAPALGSNASMISSTLLQIAFAVLFLVAAGRKFRAPDRPVFTLPLSLVLTGLWGLTLVLGFVHIGGASKALAGIREVGSAQLAFSLITFLGVSVFVLHAAAVDRLALDRRALFTKGSASPKARMCSLMPAIITLAAVLLIEAMALAMGPGLPARTQQALTRPEVWSAVGLAILSGTVLDYCLFYWGALIRAKMWVVLLFGWGFLKIAPVFVDAMLANFSREFFESPWRWSGYLASTSPLGTIMRARDPDTALFVGLGVQVLLAVLAMWLARIAQRRLRSRLKTYRTTTGPDASADIRRAVADASADSR